MPGQLLSVEVTPRRIWQATHVVATVAIPWVLAVYFLQADKRTITASAHLVADFHTKAAIAAGVLLASSVLLRCFGRSVAATIPFALMWAAALAFSISQVRAYSGRFFCESEFCIPDFGLLITAVPFAVVVSAAVIGSAAIAHWTTRL
ncbi:hypothetical protein [Gordonia soli]|uniref:Uncharacterized protein n=1 Tax=Gordonia soli NBRC 108243 TaxID=1223545 RepID=M0QQ37_9ACTN|nr:hypothetical protein [Gordonia soli]GAC69562.1 hypothetical protein GS4_26_00090 [Gordonia soli NBRC 108243]